MARPKLEPGYEIIGVSSDSEDEVPADEALEWFDAQSMLDLAKDLPDLNAPLEDFREQFGANIDEPIDLTAIPDIDVPPSDPVVIDNEFAEPNSLINDLDSATHLVHEAACLAIVLSVLPDISVDHACKFINANTSDATRTMAQCERVVSRLLDSGAYPKEADEANTRKRKRDKEDDLSDYEKGERDLEINDYEHYV